MVVALLLSISIAWTPVQDSRLVGYRVRWALTKSTADPASTHYSGVISPSQTGYDVTIGLECKPYAIYVTSVDAQGWESPPSMILRGWPTVVKPDGKRRDCRPWWKRIGR